MTESPDSLIERIQSGDKQAEQLLVEQYWRSLYFILNQRANNTELASDIAQETFIVVITKARNGQIENPAALAAFIRQVGVNLLIANYRKDQRRKTDTDEAIDVNFPDLGNQVSQSVNSEKLTELVKQVMDELPTERDRDLLYRYFVYGQEKQQVCEDFELTPEHFDRVLYRARNRLKQMLQVKLNVDISKYGLSHFLSVTLLIFIGFQPTPSSQDEKMQIFLIQVRENLNPSHFINIAVKDEPCDSLESEQYQNEVRWQ